MKYIALILTALLSTHAAAAVKINNQQVRNMDDVHSLGVIYINHNFATEQKANQALEEEADTRSAKYYRAELTHEPGSNGNLHASAFLYR